MSEFFISLLFGHLFGDFVFQNKWMAVNKSASHFKCLVHCLIYTATVVLFTGVFNPTWIAIVFGTHFIIDRWSLADVWLNWIGGRALTDYMYNGHNDLINLKSTGQNHHILRGAFSGIVYTVVDNTWHLAIGYYSYLWLLKH